MERTTCWFERRPARGPLLVPLDLDLDGLRLQAGEMPTDTNNQDNAIAGQVTTGRRFALGRVLVVKSNIAWEIFDMASLCSGLRGIVMLLLPFRSSASEHCVAWEVRIQCISNRVEYLDV